VIIMATLTIRDLDDEIRDRLRVRAAMKGVSMEAEVRAILAEAVSTDPEHPVVERMRRSRENHARFAQLAADPQSEGWVDRMRERLAETNGYWDDDFVDFVNNIRRLPDEVTYEEFVEHKDELLAEIERERARWS